MTIKLNSLSRWKTLEPQSAIMFETTSTAERRIRLHLNLEGVTSLYTKSNGEPRFLVTAGPGLETLEFNASGTLGVLAEDGVGAVQYQTAELEETFAVVVDPVIFTKIANRRHRNPELEEMMFRMQQNMERRFAQTVGEIEGAYERRRKEEEHGRSAEIVKSNAPGAAPVAGGAEVPAQKPTQSQPGQSAGSENAGQQPGDGGGKPAENPSGA